MNRSHVIELAARLGMIGPVLFALIAAGLTIAQADFMRSIGWEPFGNVLDWPSGLALGPYGWLMTAIFPVAGAEIVFFAYGLRLALEERLGTTLMMLAGFAMMGLAFTTDLTLSPAPRTWHGILHDSFFGLLGLTLMPSMLVLGFVFRRKEYWRNLATYTWVAAAFAFPAFWLKGAAFYLFLLAILAWNELIALRLQRARDFSSGG